jgi:hypothetical protein
MSHATLTRAPVGALPTKEKQVLEEQIVEAIKIELDRQASDQPGKLTVDTTQGFHVNGVIDLDALAMAVAGSIAGGP